MKIKLHLIIATLLVSLQASSQTLSIDSCGTNNSSLLNEHEIKYFVAAFNDNEINGNVLGGSRIFFAFGNYGSQPLTKQEFFDNYARSLFENNDYPQLQIIQLTEEEKQLIPEYDAIIVCWSKISLVRKARERLISELSLKVI